MGDTGGTTGTLPMGFDGSGDNDRNIACGTGRAELQGAAHTAAREWGTARFWTLDMAPDMSVCCWIKAHSS